VNATLVEIDQTATAFLTELDDLRPQEVRKEFFVEARYRGQVWELDVPLRDQRLEGSDDLRALEEAFHETHERVFAVREPGQHLECLLWKVRATAALEKPQLRSRQLLTGDAPAEGQTTAYFRETGAIEVPRLDGGWLAPNTRIEGPAIIREPTTTVVLYPGSAATVTALGNYLLEVAPAHEPAEALAGGKPQEVPA
jgi:N-methylhydantoinase A